jgi:hypothetical protein
MKITFFGLSSFLIENEKGFRLLMDPFNPAPEWTLGPDFPREFDGKPFGANIVLMSEPDADHAYAPGDWLVNAPPTKPNSNPFPGLDLRGTVIYEWNGDLNIAWHCSIDGIRLAHFADCAHVLTDVQLKEIGHPDVVFMTAPKVEGTATLDVVRKNIALIKPKIVIFAHHLAPVGLPPIEDTMALRSFFRAYFRKNASTSTNYKDENSFMELCYCLENALVLGQELQLMRLSESAITVDRSLVDQGEKQPIAILFQSMLSKARSEEV